MNTFCSECGTQLNAGASFCMGCGAGIVAMTRASTNVEPDETLTSAIPATGVPQHSATPPQSAPREQAADEGRGQTKTAPVEPQLATEAVGRAVDSTVGLAKRIGDTLTVEAAIQSALRTVGVLIGIWLLFFIAASIGLGQAELSEFVPGAGGVASLVLLLGFGGEINATVIQEQTVQGSSSWMPLIVPLVFFVALAAAQRKGPAREDRSVAAGYALVSSATAALFVIILAAMSTTTIFGVTYFDGIVSIGGTWVVPAIVVFVLAGLASGGAALLPENPDVVQALRDFGKSALVVTSIVFVIVALGFFASSLNLGAQATDSSASHMDIILALLAGAAAVILALPNVVAAVSGLLLGAGVGTREAQAGIGRSSSDLVDELASTTWSPPAYVLLGVVVVVAFALLLRIAGTTRTSRSAWWISPGVFAVAAFLVTTFANWSGSIIGSTEALGRSSEIGTAAASWGFDPFGVAIRAAVLGLAIGAALHPDVIRTFRPIADQTAALVDRARTAVAPLGRPFSKMSEKITVTAPSAVSGLELPKWVTRCGAGVLAIIVIIPVGVIAGSAAFAISGTGATSPEDLAQDIAQSITSGNGAEFAALTGSSTVPLSSSGADTAKVTLEPAGDSETYRRANIEWSVQGEQASGSISFSRDVTNEALHLFPRWTASLSYVSMPSIKGYAEVNSEGYTETVAAPLAVGSTTIDQETEVMPGVFNVASLPSTSGKWTQTTIGQTQVVAVEGPNLVQVVFTPTSTAQAAVATTVRNELVQCTSDSSSPACPSSFCAWIATPTPDDVRVEAVGPETFEATVLDVPYRQESFFGDCSESRSTSTFSTDLSLVPGANSEPKIVE